MKRLLFIPALSILLFGVVLSAARAIPAMSQLDTLERLLATQRTEYAAALDGDSILFIYRGAAWGIDLPPEYVELSRGHILTHNHPPGRCVVFSFGDVAYGGSIGVSELRVAGIDRDTGQFRTQSLTAPHGWGAVNIDDYHRLVKLVSSCAAQSAEWARLAALWGLDYRPNASLTPSHREGGAGAFPGETP